MKAARGGGDGTTDLDMQRAKDVVRILRHAAGLCRESSEELTRARQDPRAGKVWERIASTLERAADQIHKVLERGGYV